MLNVKWYVTLHLVMFIYLSVWFIVPFCVCCNADLNVEVDVHQIKNCLALESKLFLIQEYDMDEWLTKKSIGYQILIWFILKTF